MKHPIKHLRFPEAAVETVAKFRQVTGQMFGTDAMMDAPDIAFHVSDQGMDPGQDLGGFHRSKCRPSRSNQPAGSSHPVRPGLDGSCGPWSTRFYSS